MHRLAIDKLQHPNEEARVVFSFPFRLLLQFLSPMPTIYSSLLST